jgi:hypothetical protein
MPAVLLTTWVSTLSAWVALGFLGLLGIAILIQVFREKIDLSGLISEPSGEASMSRFQLLIFTFVIASSLFLVIASAEGYPKFPPDIPNGILVLLGISSSSYLVSKGIQQSSPQAPQVTISPTNSKTNAGGPAIQFQATVVGLDDKTVAWSVDPPTMGSIDATGLYSPPLNGSGKVAIKAVCNGDMSVTDTETVDLV